MNTQILSIYDERALSLAKNAIERGGAVAFATETVYGLGANAFNNDAVNSVFAIKGRPNDNPLIVHVHPEYDITKLVDFVPDYAKLLAKAFLPGPLTMVYNSINRVCSAVSCGLNTLAIRIPSHKGAQKFLEYVNLPIAAPSANVSKHVSPVTAEHVKFDLDGKIEYILDGGKCDGGIESTVLDCTGEVPCVLRSGLITKDMIAQVVGRCDEYVLKDGERARSPGMMYKHYSPACQTELYSFNDRFLAKKAYDEAINCGKRAYLLCDNQVDCELGANNVLNLGNTEEEIARNLYDKLREGERVAELIIAVAPKKQDGIMVGVMNRLTKACKG